MKDNKIAIYVFVIFLLLMIGFIIYTTDANFKYIGIMFKNMRDGFRDLKRDIASFF